MLVALFSFVLSGEDMFIPRISLIQTEQNRYEFPHNILEMGSVTRSNKIILGVSFI